jgi:ATP-dependent Clp protease protease subunit
MSQEAEEISSKELFDGRSIFIFGDINTEIAEKTIKSLLYLDSLSNEEIKIYIDSPGGETTAGFAIYDTIQSLSSPTKTIGIGGCFSFGSLLLISGTTRAMTKNTVLLFHQPLVTLEGSIQSSDITITANYVKNLKDKINNLILKHTNIKNIEEIERMVDRDSFFFADEAIKYGFVDEIL